MKICKTFWSAFTCIFFQIDFCPKFIRKKQILEYNINKMFSCEKLQTKIASTSTSCAIFGRCFSNAKQIQLICLFPAGKLVLSAQKAEWFRQRNNVPTNIRIVRIGHRLAIVAKIRCSCAGNAENPADFVELKTKFKYFNRWTDRIQNRCFFCLANFFEIKILKFFR